MFRIMSVGPSVGMWELVFGCIAVFAFVVSAYAGANDEMPEQLREIINSYRSKKLKELVTETAGNLDSDLPAPRKEAAELLHELRNDEISIWILTQLKTRSMAIEALNEREVSLQDASFILRAMFAWALPSPEPPGGEELTARAGAAMHLGEIFCKCLNQDFEQPEEYSEKVMREWAINVIDGAFEKEEVRKSKKLQLQLELLRLEVKPDEEQGQPYREKPEVAEPKQDNLLIEERADWLVPVLIVAIVVLACIVVFLLLFRKK